VQSPHGGLGLGSSPLARGTPKGSLLKGYTLARTRNLSQLNLAADAVRNYVLSVEGELRSRVPDIDNELAEELKYMRCDIDWLPRPEKVGRRAVFRGLTSICNMIEHYSQLSPRAQEKLSGFSKLALHKDIDLFRTSLREFIKIRNAVQHADGSGADPGVNLPRVEDLMFGSGALVRILCDSR
jgi:hypothetical protein